MSATVQEAVLEADRANAAIQARIDAFLAYVEDCLPHVSDLTEARAIDRLLDAIGYNGRGPFSRRRAKDFLLALQIGDEWLATHPENAAS